MIKKRFTILFIVFIVLASCYELKGPEKPENLLSKEEMVNILIDIRLLTSSTGSNRAVLENNKIVPETYVYKKHKIDSIQFASSSDYYAFYIDDYDEIYKKVRDSLKLLKELFEKQEEMELKEKTKKDSINALKVRDSLKQFKKIDSLRRKLINKKPEKGLIQPVSDSLPQPLK
ncbi:DUF4296 domain-containing protein [Hyunsoonleella aestuarii]|uniref:DUF4296 domain-containing protein n=1 Tax=Hyunsoonleella aestuarii TaxID=912802 RepID=A0ABP8EB69_9FLAO|nr:DUF4296 domain-containing protein [Hyunsoonleella aestuarii]